MDGCDEHIAAADQMREHKAQFEKLQHMTGDEMVQKHPQARTMQRLSTCRGVLPRTLCCSRQPPAGSLAVIRMVLRES